MCVMGAEGTEERVLALHTEVCEKENADVEP